MDAVTFQVRPLEATNVVTVDWTNITHDSHLEDLISWVKNSPHGQKFHVLIPSSRSHSQVRMLHHTLQTLGCRVTRKTMHSLHGESNRTTLPCSA